MITEGLRRPLFLEAMAKSNSAGSGMYASKELRRQEKKADVPSVQAWTDESFPGLDAATVAKSEELQAESKDALTREDWDALEKASRARLELVPDSLNARKNLAHARYHRGSAALAARRYKEAETLLNESLAFQRQQYGENDESVGRTLLQLGRAALGMASRRAALERLTKAKDILSSSRFAVAECDEELAKLTSLG